MALTSEYVGTAGPTVTETLEDRWVMNYAASIFDRNPVYFDNRDDRVLPAHPAYLSHLEWEAIVGAYSALDPQIHPDERIRGVHTFNDTEIFRPLHSGDTVSCTSTVVGVDSRRSGAQIEVETTTAFPDETVVARSLTTTVFRGVDLVGEPRSIRTVESPSVTASGRTPLRQETIEIDSLAAHVFSECARDYNPIHTDLRVATKAELPGLVLHGTATFALTLSSIVNHEAGGDPTRVRRFSGRLGAMVMCPSTQTLEVDTGDDGSFGFTLRTAEGADAVRGGRVELA